MVALSKFIRDYEHSPPPLKGREKVITPHALWAYKYGGKYPRNNLLINRQTSQYTGD